MSTSNFSLRAECQVAQRSDREKTEPVTMTTTTRLTKEPHHLGWHAKSDLYTHSQYALGTASHTSYRQHAATFAGTRDAASGDGHRRSSCGGAGAPSSGTPG